MDEATVLLVWGIMAHFAADWLFQDDWMATNKSSLRHPGAWVHGAIQTAFMWLVFPWGIALLIGAIQANDLPMVQTLAFIFAILIVSFNLIADLIYGILDPRIRYD
ncbi:MAG: DUF3307 domain-containing protein [Caldilineaceae bacterium]|nr:DUF3307 domain-containing protein [Caldilineaceae bacterium]